MRDRFDAGAAVLIREGQSRSVSHDRRLAVALALVAGGLNSAGFRAVGVFSANMSGNVSTVADRLALGDLLARAFYVGVVATFMVGAASATLLVAMGKRRGIRRVYALAILVEAVFLAALGFGVLAMAASSLEWLAFGLSASMGAQNAIVTLISNARVRTTHVSGMATDVGIEIGRIAELALWRESALATTPHRDGLGLHGATIASFCLGGVLGAWVYGAGGALLFFGASAILVLLCIPALTSKYP